MDYPEHDDRCGVHPFTVAVAEYIAAKEGIDLGSLRNFGEEPTVGFNKYEFIREASYFTEAFTGHYQLTPVELAEVWKSVPAELIEAWNRDCP